MKSTKKGLIAIVAFCGFLLGALASDLYLSLPVSAAEVKPDDAGHDDIAEELRSTKDQEDGSKDHNFPATAYEYAKMVEPELGVPPKVDLDASVEVPVYVDGVQAYGDLSDSADNPSRLGKQTMSGSTLQRYEGRTADGETLPDVVWVSFGRNGSFGPEDVIGSVQMIGYNKETGATAFFESNHTNLERWVSVDEGTLRMRGVMPWIDEPKEFNRAYVTPGNIQCVECHQNDPFIHSDFIDAALIPGTRETVVPRIADKGRNVQFDLPYYVVGGENWDMRTIHIEGNRCFDCHRVGMSTLNLFMSNGWDPNEHMPPNDPGSLLEDLRELLEAWKNTPENSPGTEWVVPPAGDSLGRVVGDDYPYKARFNEPGHAAFATPGITGGQKEEVSRVELISAMKAKGMTDEDIAEYIKSLGEGGKKAKSK